MVGVKAVGVSKSFNGLRVLDSISLEAGGGEIVAVLGPNGSGKTTLLKILAGILEPDSGVVERDGQVSMVPQGDSLLPWLTLRDNILLPFRLSGREPGPEVEEAVELLGLTPHLSKYPREASGGTRRKTAIARALAVGAQVILLDEPFTGLDAHSVLSLSATLERLAGEGKSIVLVSHQLWVIAETAARAYILAPGPRGSRISSTLDLSGLNASDRHSSLKSALAEAWNPS